MKKVLIIILNFNGLELLKKHLGGVVSTEYDVLVVDNGSTDNSIEYLKSEYPDVKILELDKNYGFAVGNNKAVKQYPDYQYYAFVNNDIDVEKDWLEKLLETIQKENVGAVGPKILYSKNKDIINSAGIELDRFSNGYDRYDGQKDSQKYNVVEEVDALCGAVLLVNGNAFREVEGFDERMFFYYEDIDLCLRLRDLGYKLMYDGRSVVYHDHMGTSSKWKSFRRNVLSLKHRYLSVAKRKGFLVALIQLKIWLFLYFIWKVFYSKRNTLREFTKRYEK